MPRSVSSKPGMAHAIFEFWREQSARDGFLPALRRLVAVLWNFLRESAPSRRRQRYGDVDYDWDYRVHTTSATIGWRERLLGMLHSPYQPTEPALFREMMGALNIDFREFTFIDIGSGKGRVLLMAAEYPFRRIVGVELLPELHRVAQQNTAIYKSDSQQCFAVESVCRDAREFVFPPEPAVLYLFNPLPEAGLIRMMSNLEQSLRQNPGPVYVLYHNPLLEHVLSQSTRLQKVGGTHQYAVFTSVA